MIYSNYQIELPTYTSETAIEIFGMLENLIEKDWYTEVSARENESFR